MSTYMQHLHTVPSDVLLNVFPMEVRNKWRRNPTEELIRRLEILCSCGPYPSDLLAASRLRFFRARKAAWEAYLSTSFACGLFESARGKDLRQKLTREDMHEFRSALAECTACWFLAGRMKFPIIADAHGRAGKKLDMAILQEGAPIGVEVKSPYREKPKEGISWGDDSDKIAQVIKDANKQFDNKQANILFFIPDLRFPAFMRRDELIKAAFGESKITGPFNPQTGTIGPVEVKFFPEGKFLNTKYSKTKQPGYLLPAYRRISIILCVEEKRVEKYPLPDPRVLYDEKNIGEAWPYWEKARDMHFNCENEALIDHEVLVVHNPHAYHPLSQEVWKEFPQFVPEGNTMVWTDGYDVSI